MTSEQTESQAPQVYTNGTLGIGGRHAKSEVSSGLELFFQKLTTKNIQSVDLFTFRIHEILEYIHFRTTNIPHELFYQATKPVLLSNYGFYHSYKYDLTLPFFCHLLPYKLAFAGFLRKESRTNDTLARYGLLYATMAYSSIEQVISRINLSEECIMRKDSVVADGNTLLMKPSCLLTDSKSTPVNDLSITAPDYPLGFDYPAIVAPLSMETYLSASFVLPAITRKSSEARRQFLPSISRISCSHHRRLLSPYTTYRKRHTIG